MQFTEGTRGAQVIAPGLTMAKLYEIMHDRLENCRLDLRNGPSPYPQPLDNYIDVDAVAQNFCCEVEKALGIYPNNKPPAPDEVTVTFTGAQASGKSTILYTLLGILTHCGAVLLRTNGTEGHSMTLRLGKDALEKLASARAVE